MKKIVFVLLLVSHLLGYGEGIPEMIPSEMISSEMPDSIGSYSLLVSERYTTNLIFPAAIFQVDLGTGDVLLLKAGRAHFLPTNVSVYLANGALYSFRVSYSDTLATFNYMFRGDGATRGEAVWDPARGKTPSERTNKKDSSLVIFSGSGVDAGKMKEDARLLKKARPFLHAGASDGKVRLVLKSAYLKEHLLWLGFKARNRSLIDFRPDVMRFSMEDRKRVRRTAIQSIGLTPVYVSAPVSLAGGSQNNLVAAFTPFTIVRGKSLVVEWSSAYPARNPYKAGIPR